jgi:NTE family protein
LAAGSAGHRLGIALGGGAARGMAHIGVIKVMEREGIRFDLVAGNSAGSMVGALYAAGMSWKDMYDFASGIRPLDILRKRSHLCIRSEQLEEIMRRALGDMTFADLTIPLTVIAVNIRTGELVRLTEGPVARAVRASCSVPGVFTPTPWGDMMLIDGGTLNSVPADVAREMGADRVIGVNLNRDRRSGTRSNNRMQILLAAINMMMSANAERGILASNVMISPDLAEYKYHRLDSIDELVKRGEAAAEAALPQIEKILA